MAFNKENYRKLKEKMRTFARIGGSVSDGVKILAATKYAAINDINQAIESGITVIGENKIQDAIKKFPCLKPVEMHFIGHLQGNKVKLAVDLFDWIESVDSIELAEKISKEAQKLGKVVNILVEVNVAEDKGRFGISLGETGNFLKSISSMGGLRVRGLMAIVPFFEDIDKTRPYFRKMRKLFINSKKLMKGMDTLSMGMSNDFEIAVEEGSTEIRIGSLLFK